MNATPNNTAWEKLWDWLLSDDELPEPQEAAIGEKCGIMYGLKGCGNNQSALTDTIHG